MSLLRCYFSKMEIKLPFRIIQFFDTYAPNVERVVESKTQSGRVTEGDVGWVENGRKTANLAHYILLGE